MFFPRNWMVFVLKIVSVAMLTAVILPNVKDQTYPRALPSLFLLVGFLWLLVGFPAYVAGILAEQHKQTLVRVRAAHELADIDATLFEPGIRLTPPAPALSRVLFDLYPDSERPKRRSDLRGVKDAVLGAVRGQLRVGERINEDGLQLVSPTRWKVKTNSGRTITVDLAHVCDKNGRLRAEIEAHEQELNPSPADAPPSSTP